MGTIAALHFSYTTVRIALLCIAAGFWTLYFHEILFRSGRMRAAWLKKGLADILLILSIALVTFLVFSFVSDYHAAPASHVRAR
jgi:hypothetical protein